MKLRALACTKRITKTEKKNSSSTRRNKHDLNRISDSNNSERNNEKRNVKTPSSLQSTQLLLLTCKGGIQNLKTGITGEIRDLGSEAVDLPTRIVRRVDTGSGIHSQPQQVGFRVRLLKKRPCPIRNVRNKNDAGGDD